MVAKRMCTDHGCGHASIHLIAQKIITTASALDDCVYKSLVQNKLSKWKRKKSRRGVLGCGLGRMRRLIVRLVQDINTKATRSNRLLRDHRKLRFPRNPGAPCDPPPIHPPASPVEETDELSLDPSSLRPEV